MAAPRVRLAVILASVLVVVMIAGRGATRSPWGAPTSVVVASTDLRAGHRVGPDDVRLAQWPTGLVPEHAIVDPAEAVGRDIAAPVAAGLPLTVTSLADAGPAAGVPAGRVALPVEIPGSERLRVGQRVDVLAGDGAGSGVRLASVARVLAVDGEVVWLEVGRDEAPAVAGAARWGELTLAVLPPE